MTRRLRAAIYFTVLLVVTVGYTVRAAPMPREDTTKLSQSPSEKTQSTSDNENSISLDELSESAKPHQGEQSLAKTSHRRRKRQSYSDEGGLEMSPLDGVSLVDQLSTLSDGELAELSSLLQTMRDRSVALMVDRRQQRALQFENERLSPSLAVDYGNRLLAKRSGGGFIEPDFEEGDFGEGGDEISIPVLIELEEPMEEEFTAAQLPMESELEPQVQVIPVLVDDGLPLEEEEDESFVGDDEEEPIVVQPVVVFDDQLYDALELRERINDLSDELQMRRYL